jgi:Fe-S oxidoreductase
MHRWAVLSSERIQLQCMLVRDILLGHCLQLHELPRRRLCGIGGGLGMHQLFFGEELIKRDRLDELHELRCG